MESQGITSSGPALIRYLTTDMSKKLDIKVGFAIENAVAGDDRIIVDILPARRYAVLSYTGPYKGKGVFKANVALLEWAKENHIVWQTSNVDNVEWWGSRVEWYLTDPEKEPDTKNTRLRLPFWQMFVAARHCLQLLWKVGAVGKDQREKLVTGLEGRFKECIIEKNCTLIRYEILQVLRNLYDAVKDENVKTKALGLIEIEEDTKYRKKYASLWRAKSWILSVKKVNRSNGPRVTERFGSSG